jgi:DNA-binding phage protein
MTYTQHIKFIRTWLHQHELHRTKNITLVARQAQCSRQTIYSAKNLDLKPTTAKRIYDAMKGRA